MGPGQQADLALDRPQVLGPAAVGPLAVQDQLADDPLLDRAEGGLDPRRRDRRVGRHRAGSRIAVRGVARVGAAARPTALRLGRNQLLDDRVQAAPWSRRSARPSSRSAWPRGAARRSGRRSSAAAGRPAIGGMLVAAAGPPPRSALSAARSISWLNRWASMIASPISGSGSSSPKPSIMTTAFSVLETIRSRSLFSSSSAVGNATSWPSTRAQPDRADRAEERDPRQQQRGRGADHRRARRRRSGGRPRSARPGSGPRRDTTRGRAAGSAGRSAAR